MSFDPTVTNGPANPDNPDDAAGEGADGGQPTGRKFAGKYASIDDLEQGYLNQQGETGRIIGERDVLREQNALLARELEAVRMARGTAQPAEPAFPTTLRVGEDGVDTAPLQQGIERTVSQMVSQQVQQIMAPLLAGATARSRMIQMDPDFASYESKALAIVGADPRKAQVYNELMATSPLAAMQLAAAEYRAATAVEAARAAAAGNAATEHGKTQAGIVAPGSPQGRANKPDFDQREYDRLLKDAQETGDFSKFMDYRFKGMFPNWQFANAGQGWGGQS